MRVSTVVIGLSLVIMVLAGLAAGVGLVWNEPVAPDTFRTVRGESVEMYGLGLYRYDSLFQAAIYRGQDAITLLLGIPLLAIAVWLYGRGSLKGGLLLVGTLAYFLYVYVSMAFSATFNELFLVYTALLAAGLFAFVAAFASIDSRAWQMELATSMPRRGPASFLIASGAITLGLWGLSLGEVVLTGGAPGTLGSATTMVTHALDMGVIAPAAILAGVWILRGKALGVIVAMSLLVLEALLAPLVLAQTISQLTAGVALRAADVVQIVGFAVLGVFAVWVIAVMFRHMPSEAPLEQAPLPHRDDGSLL